MNQLNILQFKYESANKVLKQSGKIFYFAKHFLNQNTAKAATSLYQFCRYVDDIADDKQNKDTAQEKLKTIKEHIQNEKSDLYWIHEFLQLCQNHNIDKQHGITLIDGVTSDLGSVRIQDEKQLIEYCYSVAGVVGELMSPILTTKPGGKPFAIDLGIAMQLTNIARDVKEDANMDRIYLPSAWLPNFSPQRILSSKSKDRIAVKNAIKKILSISEEYYSSAFKGMVFLPKKNAKAIEIAGRTYRQIGINLTKNKFNYWQKKTTVSTLQKIGIAKSIIFNKKTNNTNPLHNNSLHLHLNQLHFKKNKSNKERQHDVVILGGGAAGLSLAMELGLQNNQHLNCLILEAREHYYNDRSWCFWHFSDLSEHITQLISHQWNQWEINTHSKSIILNSTQHPYSYISSLDFYNAAQEIIKQCPLTELNMNCHVHSVFQSNSHFTIKTSIGNFKAKHVIDTRPVNNNSIRQNGLHQIFYGVEVRYNNANAAPINNDTVTLMGNLKNENNGVNFEYILPFSDQHALFEFTVFSHNSFSPDELKEKCKHFIHQKLGHSNYTIIRDEKGLLPMVIPTLEKTPNTMTLAGIRGGSLRPASGYAFTNIQRWAQQCASTLLKNNTLSPYKPQKTTHKLDDLFLTVIRNNPSIAASLFTSMASGLNGCQFARFMSEKATFMDLFKVIKSMPYRPFLQALLKAATKNDLKQKIEA